MSPVASSTQRCQESGKYMFLPPASLENCNMPAVKAREQPYPLCAMCQNLISCNSASLQLQRPVSMNAFSSSKLSRSAHPCPLRLCREATGASSLQRTGASASSRGDGSPSSSSIFTMSASPTSSFGTQVLSWFRCEKRFDIATKTPHLAQATSLRAGSIPPSLAERRR